MPRLSANWPEVFLSTADIRRAVSDAARAGRVRKLASRLYTTNLRDEPEKVVRQHLWPIVALYFPGALIADRTALENGPAEDGSVFLVAERRKDVELPGLRLRARTGHPPLEDDLPFVGGLRLSSPARAFLENMRPSRKPYKGGVSRTLARERIEERLDSLLRRGSEQALGTLRDHVRRIAPVLGLEKEARELDDLIGTLLGSRKAAISSPVTVARVLGRPYDPERLALFEKLHAALRGTPPVPRSDPGRAAEGQTTLAFFEAYFSNFIEGTEFEVEEAAEIVFQGRIPRQRPEDAHDILGTYRIVASETEMRRVSRSSEEFLSLLRDRHARIMIGRPDKRPGLFKETANRAGATRFVEPSLVEGTLFVGLEVMGALADPLHRAIFMMFLVSEVHPFDDGNGRVARVMMNAELVAKDEQRIVIPTVYRENYLAGLRALSRNGRPDALIRVLDFAQRYSLAIEWGELWETQRLLEKTNAFLEPEEAEARGVFLRIPAPDMIGEDA